MPVSHNVHVLHASSPSALLLPPCHLQTKQGNTAVGLTSMEFEEIMDAIRSDAETLLGPAVEEAGGKAKIIYSWDHDKIHVGADLAKVGITDDVRLELPECSSDMHKVIEHVHGHIQREFEEWLWGFEQTRPTVQECMEQVEEIFRVQVTQQSVLKDVHTLHKTYEAIIKAEGGYPAKTYR